MYTEFYALSARPFQLSPNPSFFYPGRAHRRAVAYLTFGLQQGEGFIVITGEVGAGKTTLVAYLGEELGRRRLFVAGINAVSLEARDTLALVARALELEPDAERSSIADLSGLIERELRRRHGDRQRVLLVVDEAQNLGPGALEALRVLSNLTQDDRALIQILLLGQPQFRDLLARPALEQLRQRVVASAHLGPLEPDEVRPYLEHRLRRVGWAGNPAFEPGLFGEVFALSRGLPRRINLLAARLLVHGALEQRDTLTAADARELAQEIEREQHAPPAPEPPPPGARPPVPSPEPAAITVAAATAPAGDEVGREARGELQRLRLKLEDVYDDLTRERDRSEVVRQEAERLRGELSRIEVERLRVDAETTRRLAEVLAEVGALRRRDVPRPADLRPGP